MTPLEQKIAILEKCGWVLNKLWPTEGEHMVFKRGDEVRLLSELPDPTKDLNAMKQAVDRLTHEEVLHYQRLLCDAIGGPHYAIDAAAAPRASAFCRVFWPERFKETI